MALVYAIRAGKHDVVATLSARIKNINYQNMKRYTLLHTAVEYNDITAAELLIEQGADLMAVPEWTGAFHSFTIGQKHPALPNPSPLTVECPLLMAFEMGESHEEMQLLLMRTVYGKLAHMNDEARLRHTKKIKLLGHYAMLYCTPHVFCEAVRYNGDANQRDTSNMTALMCTLRHMSVIAGCLRRGCLWASQGKGAFGTPPLYAGLPERPSHAQCKQTLANVAEMVERHPEMLWERFTRLSCEEQINKHGWRPDHDWSLRSWGEVCPGSRNDGKAMPARGYSLWGATNSFSITARGIRVEDQRTALGMVVFDTLPYRRNHHMLDIRYHYCTSEVCCEPIKNESAFIKYFTDDFVPTFWLRMICEMRTALGMATHVRLGSDSKCLIAMLDADVMNFIFNTVMNTTDIPDQQHTALGRNFALLGNGFEYIEAGAMQTMIC